MNDTTKRHPRTLNEAFGPYASGPIYDDEPPYQLADLCVMAVCFVGVVVLLVVL